MRSISNYIQLHKLINSNNILYNNNQYTYISASNNQHNCSNTHYNDLKFYIKKKRGTYKD